MDILYSFPNSFRAGVAIALTAEEATETGDEPDHLTQWRRGLRGLWGVERILYWMLSSDCSGFH